MGNIPHGFQIGDACNTCVGVIFEELRTPAYLAIEFTGIEKLFPDFPDPPNGHRFVLIETEYCVWMVSAYIGLWLCTVWVWLDYEGKGTRIMAEFPLINELFFFFTDPVPCIIEGDSELPDPLDPRKDAYSGGSCRINWGSAINESAWREQNLFPPPPP